MPKSVFKNDRYKSARGGYSRLLSISCGKCGLKVCEYQKDGPGNLRRMYVDRISSANVSLTDKALVCKCGHILGVRMTYEKENRSAFRLIPSAVNKTIIKS